MSRKWALHRALGRDWKRLRRLLICGIPEGFEVDQKSPFGIDTNDIPDNLLYFVFQNLKMPFWFKPGFMEDSHIECRFWRMAELGDPRIRLVRKLQLNCQTLKINGWFQAISLFSGKRWKFTRHSAYSRANESILIVRFLHHTKSGWDSIWVSLRRSGKKKLKCRMNTKSTIQMRSYKNSAMEGFQYGKLQGEVPMIEFRGKIAEK